MSPPAHGVLYQATSIPAPMPVGPSQSTQALPSVLHSERGRMREGYDEGSGLKPQPTELSASALAARAAVRNASSESPPSSSDRRPNESSSPSRSNIAVAKDSDSGRSLSPANPPPAAKHNSPPPAQQLSSDEEQSVHGERRIRAEGARRRGASQSSAHLRTPSAPARSGRTPDPSAQFTDERTGLTENSLADAIVASSLATSRAPSPRRNETPAPPPPRKPSRTRSLFHNRHSSERDAPRYGTPQKGLRQTLRKQPSEDSEDDRPRKRHKHRMTHPHKHHEGSRKRWKDKVTDRERKRFEGVWAANRGIFLTDIIPIPNLETSNETLASDRVLDLVVRDIWIRSRLPADVLAEIWDLVDRESVGSLNRDEFVVGLWLIDQRLKGRKLPIRVSPTLWGSVRHIQGVKVPRKLT
jgi:Cytoskeletal-regulatory complex EF hand